jgi:hypothetical protein
LFSLNSLIMAIMPNFSPLSSIASSNNPRAIRNALASNTKILPRLDNLSTHFLIYEIRSPKSNLILAPKTKCPKYQI